MKDKTARDEIYDMRYDLKDLRETFYLAIGRGGDMRILLDSLIEHLGLEYIYSPPHDVPSEYTLFKSEKDND